MNKYRYWGNNSNMNSMDVGFAVRGYRQCVISGFHREVAEN